MLKQKIKLLNSTAVGFARHQHESALAHVCPPAPEHPSQPPAHSISPGCPRALAVGALHHTSNSHWLSVLYVVMYMFLAWRIPGMGEPGGMPSTGSQSQIQVKRRSSSSSLCFNAKNIKYKNLALNKQ